MCEKMKLTYACQPCDRIREVNQKMIIPCPSCCNHMDLVKVEYIKDNGLVELEVRL